MKDLVLIDTSGWICFFSRCGYKEMKKQISILLDEDRVVIAGPIMIELIQGTRNEGEKEKVNGYVKGLHWLPVTDDHWHQSADFAFKLRKKGITSSAIDVLIATLAMDYQCSLLHEDSDFDQISRHSSLACYPR